MGMQQILLIVLSVIIVGAAVAVGITMFSTQAVNANRSAVLMDLNTFGAAAIAYYKTPTDQGGGGHSFEASCDSVGYYLANNYSTTGKTITNDNGDVYTLSIDGDNLKIVGVGTEKGRSTVVGCGDRVGGTMTIDPEASDPLVLTLTN
jgi:hypothetical protein